MVQVAMDGAGGSAAVIAQKSGEEFVANALDAVRIGFVSNIDEIRNPNTALYPPEFAHQHFGDNETIFGYSKLGVRLYYSSSTLYFLPMIEYERDICTIEKDIKSDDIITKLKAQLPENQPGVMVESEEAFRKKLNDQKTFRPFGTMIDQFPIDSRNLQLYKVSESSPEFDAYLERLQTIALWYIDAAQFTDNADPHWTHYILYEHDKSADATDSSPFALVGYASVYRFYAYPQHTRPRIAQILLLPGHRRRGIGARLLQAVYNDLVPEPSVIDITAEDPSDNFIFLRDFVDCCNVAALPEFAPSALKTGFSDEMREAALKKLKIGHRQSRRVYEILRLMATNCADAEEMKAYRIDVKRRLDAPLKKSERDWKKLQRALNEREMTTVAANALNAEQRMQQLQAMFDETVDNYRSTINRLKTFGGCKF